MNIKELRKKRGITQEELSERIGVHENTIRLWEKGTREPRSSDIAKLCEVLGCTESELLNGPASQTWELRLVVNKAGNEKKGETVDMSGTTATAVMNLSDDAMAITLSAGYALWEDDAQFEAIIEDFRRKRQSGLKLRKENW
ncbi:MAG: helix-turn-helix transcriptional regulator [Synergistaceae bacterium]|nr:helix-turn-helix transcriptional regulator [Synergistaceae bacterium]